MINISSQLMDAMGVSLDDPRAIGFRLAVRDSDPAIGRNYIFYQERNSPGLIDELIGNEPWARQHFTVGYVQGIMSMAPPSKIFF